MVTLVMIAAVAMKSKSTCPTLTPHYSTLEFSTSSITEPITSARTIYSVIEASLEHY